MVSRIPPPEDDGAAGRRPRASGLLALVLVVALAAGVWLLNGGGDDTGPTVATDGTPTSPPAAGPSDDEPGSDSGSSDSGSSDSGADDPTGPTGEPDPASGLPTIYLLDLPPEAAETVGAIERGPPFAYEKDGSTFGNFEGLLPDEERGYYREFTVETPGSPDRGARRIVEGAGGELYWTDDHYASFARILL